MFESSFARILATLLAGALVVGIFLAFPKDNLWVIFASCCVLILIVLCYDLDYTSLVTVYALPWLMIVFFSTIPISEYYMPLDVRTYALIFTCLFVWLLGAAIGPASVRSPRPAIVRPVPRVSIGLFRALFLALCIALAAECAISGFVPLISLLMTGDSRYIDFGIPGIHGAILAYANALGGLSFYLFLVYAKRGFLLSYFSILGLFIALVSRQNVITLLTETLVIWCLVRRPLSRITVGASVCALLVAFSVFGELRSGDILDLIKVTPEYAHLPKAAYWLYAYSYFNVLNLQNMMENSGAPFFDGSMLNQLLPSFLRSTGDQSSYLVYANMTVTSYMDPVFRDVGLWGTVGITFFFALVTGTAFRKAVVDRTFFSIACYACLYYCALFSFFVNNWFYLPVIFQIVFYWIFDRLLLDHRSTEAADPAPVQVHAT